MNDLASIEVVSGVNDAGDGFVTVTAIDKNRGMMLGQLPPETMRELGMHFLQVAEAAETDAIVYRLLERIGLEKEIIGAFVNDMRNARDT